MRYNGKKALIVKLKSQQKDIENLTVQLRALNLEIGETLTQLKEESSDHPSNKEQESRNQAEGKKQSHKN